MDEIGFVSGSLLVVLLTIVGIAAIGLTGGGRAQARFQIQIFLSAIVLRYAVSLILYQFGLINVIKDEDGSGWVVGAAILQEWSQQGVGLLELPAAWYAQFGEHHRGYYCLLATFFMFIEPARLPAAALNCFFGSIMIVYAYRTAELVATPQVAKRVGVWLCVFPSLILWSSQTIKEPVVILLEVLAIYNCSMLRMRGFSLFRLLATGFCIVLLLPFRFYAAYLATAAVLIASLVPSTSRGGIRIGSKALTTLGLIGVVGFLVMSGVLVGREVRSEQFDLDYIQKMKNYSALGGSGVEVKYDLHTSSGMGIALLIGSVHLLLAPFPWQLASGSVRMLMVGPEMCYWWWLFFVGLIPGFRSLMRTRLLDIAPLLVMLLGFGMLYSLTFGNVGLVYRQRAQLLPWLLIFAAVGLEQKRLRHVSREGRNPWNGRLPSASNSPSGQPVRLPDEWKGIPTEVRVGPSSGQTTDRSK